MTRDLHLPGELEPIEQRLRKTLRAVAESTPIADDADGDVIVVATADVTPLRPRRWVAAVAAAGVIAAGAAAVVGAGSAPSSMVATEGDAARTTSSLASPAVPVPASVPVDYLLPDALPPGFRGAFTGRSGTPVRATSSVDVYAAGGDRSAERAVVVLRTSVRAALGSVLPFEEGVRETVGGRTVLATSMGALRGYDVTGPDDLGGVALIGRGIDEAELRTVAAALVGEGQAADALPEGLQLVYQGRHPFIEAPTDDVVLSHYSTDDGLREIELRTVAGAPDALGGVAWQLDGTRRDVRVRDAMGVSVTSTHAESGSISRQLVWSEGNITVSLTGRRVSEDELLAFARTLRPALRPEVDALVARSEAELSED